MALMLNFILDLFLQGVQMTLVLVVAPLVLGVTRKVKARLLRRRGPGVLQPYRDLWKLMHKEAVLAHNASWLYRAAPYLLFATTWVTAALVPTYAINLMFSWSADLIAIVALLAVVVYLVAVPFLLFAGFGAVIFFIATAWLLSREYFDLAAMRFKPPDEAKALRKRNATQVFIAGLFIAAFVSIPIVNLATPLFAMALMVHLHKRVGGPRLIAQH